jgi:hypothetical protein
MMGLLSNGHPVTEKKSATKIHTVKNFYSVNAVDKIHYWSLYFKNNRSSQTQQCTLLWSANKKSLRHCTNILMRLREITHGLQPESWQLTSQCSREVYTALVMP